jgi:hypothetical protein
MPEPKRPRSAGGTENGAGSLRDSVGKDEGGVGAVIVAEGNAGENTEQRQVLPCPDVLITPILVLEQG